MLVDQLRITVSSGKGGDGAVSFRREKGVPQGGPDGGNGGNGGSLWLVVNEQYNTLLDVGDKKIFEAQEGQKGGTAMCTGRNGKDLFIGVPKGTIVRDAEGNILADLTDEKQKWKACQGGFGGRGNTSYKTSVKQSPTYSNNGTPGEEKLLFLELKLMADVGLVGFPNAGKSSLVNRISSAKPKVGDYPFTTLEPVLGIVQMSTWGSFVVADIPGLIEGASQGKGLGHQFLKHIERTYCLLFVIDGLYGAEAWDHFCILRKELEEFHPALIEKPFVVALNKCDGGIDDAIAIFKENKQEVVVTSAVDGTGAKKLIIQLENHVRPTQVNAGGWKYED